MTYRVLITASRTWTRADVIHAALNRLHAVHGNRLVVVHGACPKGGDVIADGWAVRNRVQVERHPADWNAYGRSAGFRRNAEMVATRPDECLAFIRDRSAGASHCAREAEKVGIPTTRFDHDPASGLIWHSTPAATVGLVVVDGVVVGCPPYARKWALGRDAREVWRQAARRGVDLEWLPASGPAVG